ncbi:long-chain fatty acid--CoA ligase [Amycolatopsis sp. FDAARGOS 1241]|uniref:long-chain-fatty-acid--CoA ligase n=1 Tax=Amycolatopsis sp. FDAARGOS 1241 TaxID=2778070 RepID=UPI00194FE517|nr:long-chain fatty acid--CoA ligase [Amycolatopsis sp. FDAARGOS 1241]QRP43415.1 long-chain fatty acid--CoA ligase [Amycolatopsis sp. FDAARGOS 1241]
MSFNLATILRESALAQPEKDFLRFPGGIHSYAEVDELSGRVATALRQRGLAPGDKVAVQLPNVPEFVFAYFGILKAGLVMVPLNPLLKAGEIAYHLADSDARLLIAGAAVVDEAAKALTEVPAVSAVVAGDLDGWPAGTVPFARLLDAPDDGDLYPGAADDTGVLLYTSGTTGRPKGAELSHFSLYMTCTIGGQTFGAEPDDVVLAVLPFFHVYGLSSILNSAARHSRTVSVVPRFEPQAVLAAIERDRVTIMAGVPTMYHALAVADSSGYDTSSLRIGSSGGAAIPEQVLGTFEEKYGIPVLEGYGLSESASTTTVNPGAANRKVLSIGKPIWGVQLRIVDGADRPLPPGPDHVGEIVLRGHNITKGYYKRPAETAEAFRGGWFHTGDLGYVDDDGFVFVVDRKKDLVIRGGYNVYPREVEELLYRHPAIAEAAVIGEPDDRLGEEIVAVVSLKPGAAAEPEEIVAWAKERIAAYKYPRRVRIVPELPKGPTGKITKLPLRGQ